MENDPRYAPITQILPAQLPPLSRIEADRAQHRLIAHFGRKELGSVNQLYDAPLWRVRACWVTRKPTGGHFKGWGRLVHDVAHYIFRRRHPSFAPHAGGHAALEIEIAQYVVAKGWLEGALAPPKKAKTGTAAARIDRLNRISAGIKRWESKERRAANALKKLRRQFKALGRTLAGELHNPSSCERIAE